MDYALFAVPILPGKTGAARAFLEELERDRGQQFDVSERRLGNTRELWAIQQTPQGDLYVVYAEASNMASAFQQFAVSQDPFDVWFKREIVDTTGMDVNTPPPGPMSEILSDHLA